jgi:CBS domain-containing protein
MGTEERMDRPISEFMSSPVFTVGASQTVSEARHRMTEHDTRHLVVLRGGHLRGVVSDRDLAIVEGVLGGSAETTQVEEVMSEEVFEVSSEALISQVAQTMAGKRIGAAIVVDNGEPTGIFTTTDALRALAQAFD